MNETQTRTETQADERLGSAAYFDRAWRQTRAAGGGRGLVYPREQPTTQYDLFERVKAVELDTLLERYHLKQGLVLEYGCGSAGMSVYLMNRGFRAVCCDLSLNALELAQMNCAAHRNGASTTLTRVAGNALRLPFDDNVFDVVMSYGLLEHFDPAVLDELLCEVVRTLRPGGLFVADIAHGRFSSRTAGLVVSMLGSWLYYGLTLRGKSLAEMRRVYFGELYENQLDEREWAVALERAGLSEVRARVLHPFPPFALQGRLERGYIHALLALRGVWQWYHRAQPRWARRWGWLYFVSGIKK